MGFNRSQLNCLGMLTLLLLGGCSWISEVQSSNPFTGSQPPQTQGDGNTESRESVQASRPIELSPEGAIADPTIASEDSEHAPDSPSESAINHGERLSTLGDELPPGRLPPEIVPATGDAQRLPVIEPGRRDPFASLPTRPFLVQQAATSSAAVPSFPSRPAEPSPQPAAVPSSPQAVSPVPIASQLPAAPVASAPPRVVPQPVPTIPVATAPELAQPSVPESVSVASSLPASPSFEFSGVVQMGDRVNIIVEEPSGSRYVQVGERVGNGQFVIKSVDFNQGATPAVILERGGTETVHWVGSPIAL